MKELLVQSSQVLGTRVKERGRNEVPCNEFFQKALAYEKTIAREVGILMPY
jgi:hypothetical protein